MTNHYNKCLKCHCATNILVCDACANTITNDRKERRGDHKRNRCDCGVYLADDALFCNKCITKLVAIIERKERRLSPVDVEKRGWATIKRIVQKMGD